MSWQDDVMIEQDRADALEHMGEAEWRDMYEERHGWTPDYEFETIKCNKTNEEQSKITAKGTEAFKEALSEVLGRERKEVDKKV